MGTVILVLQGLIAFVFIFSGINKSYYDEETLVQKGQTGVEGLPNWFIKFIGISEILGAIGMVIPMLLHKWDMLTPISAICLGFIMLPAAYIHKKRGELKNVAINIVIFFVCGFIAYYYLR